MISRIPPRIPARSLSLVLRTVTALLLALRPRIAGIHRLALTLLLALTLRLVWKPHSSPSRALHGSRSSGWFANWRTLPAAIAPPSRSSVCRRAEHLRLVPELAAGIRGSDRNQDAQHDAACYPKSAEYHAGHRHPPPGLAAPLDLPHRDHAED